MRTRRGPEADNGLLLCASAGILGGGTAFRCPVDIGPGDEKVRQGDDVGAAGVFRPGGAVFADGA